MRISTVREFRDQATGLLRSKDPILVTRRGRIAGVFFPCPGLSIPLELKREMFAMLSGAVAREIKKKGLTEKGILVDLERWRKEHRGRQRHE